MHDSFPEQVHWVTPNSLRLNGTAFNVILICVYYVRSVDHSEREVGVEGAMEEVLRGGPRPPGFLKQLKNKHCFTEFPAIFDCLVLGNPTPDVEW